MHARARAGEPPEEGARKAGRVRLKGVREVYACASTRRRTFAKVLPGPCRPGSIQNAFATASVPSGWREMTRRRPRGGRHELRALARPSPPVLLSVLSPRAALCPFFRRASFGTRSVTITLHSN